MQDDPKQPASSETSGNFDYDSEDNLEKTMMDIDARQFKPASGEELTNKSTPQNSAKKKGLLGKIKGIFGKKS